MRSLNVFRILLDLKDLDRDEKARADLVGAVLKQAPQSQLYAKSPTLQAELKNLGGDLLQTLIEHEATSMKDVQETAFEAYQGKPPVPALEAPQVVRPKPGRKGSGKAEAVVHETGRIRQRYAAEWSPDPVTETSWVGLPGYGKSRKLTGKSGTSIWVRFALVRAGQQSAWSVPLLITFP